MWDEADEAEEGWESHDGMGAVPGIEGGERTEGEHLEQRSDALVLGTEDAPVGLENLNKAGGGPGSAHDPGAPRPPGVMGITEELVSGAMRKLGFPTIGGANPTAINRNAPPRTLATPPTAGELGKNGAPEPKMEPRPPLGMGVGAGPRRSGTRLASELKEHHLHP